MYENRVIRENIRANQAGKHERDEILVIKTSKRDYADLFGESSLETLEEDDEIDGKRPFSPHCEDDPLDQSELVRPDTVMSEQLLLSTSSESETETTEPRITITIENDAAISNNKRKKRWTRQQKRERKLAEKQCQSVPKRKKKKMSEDERLKKEIPPTPGAALHDKPLVLDQTPMHLRDSVSFDNVCTFCGGGGESFHLRRNCGIFRRQRQRKEDKLSSETPVPVSVVHGQVQPLSPYLLHHARAVLRLRRTRTLRVSV